MKRNFAIFSFLPFLFFCSGTKPENLGIKENKLTPCPQTPNCVSSYSSPEDKEHFIKPITYNSSLSEEVNRVKNSAKNLPRAKLIKEEENYLYFEFTSLLMRYVDDVEFYFDDSAKLIHVRSASRVGKSDFGVNRERIEKFEDEIKKLR
ncbi:MAG: DUF1499 domain-containing protein [Leptospiraceae bacterium]|nr:DUF1499 domain-containing protein [Leptospiraceae bacterium]